MLGLLRVFPADIDCWCCRHCESMPPTQSDHDEDSETPYCGDNDSVLLTMRLYCGQWESLLRKQRVFAADTYNILAEASKSYTECRLVDSSLIPICTLGIFLSASGQSLEVNVSSTLFVHHVENAQ